VGCGYRYVERNAADHLDRVRTANLYQYREPVSPHLARQLAPELVSRIIIIARSSCLLTLRRYPGHTAGLPKDQRSPPHQDPPIRGILQYERRWVHLPGDRRRCSLSLLTRAFDSDRLPSSSPTSDPARRFPSPRRNQYDPVRLRIPRHEGLYDRGRLRAQGRLL
jgi:hypothetical protein